MRAMDDATLSGLTQIFRSRLSKSMQGDATVPIPMTTITSILPEAFAAIREASYRVLGLRHYDVQLLGGMALSEGHIAEMATGEGKTLVALLPAYLYALTGKGVHIITVNEYLASRDAAWVGKVLEFMGLTVGVVTLERQNMNESRRSAFEADVTYLTAYDLAFTFLHDNMVPTVHGVALRRPLHYAIVDEVDSILIDEARNPFIVNAPDASDTLQARGAAECWKLAVRIAESLDGPSPQALSMVADAMQDVGIPREEYLPFDFIPDYRYKNATLTQQGMRRVVRILASPAVNRVLLARKTNALANDLYTILVHPQGTEYSLVTIGQGSTFQKTTKRVDSTKREDIERFLAEEVHLDVLPPDSLTDDVVSSAAPMALWTGDDANSWGRYILTAVRAVHLYKRDIDYVVRNGQVIIVDTSTGRERLRSRWQSGIHQALEAFENVTIKEEDFDRGRVTYQSLFRGYARLCGMTGTAMTEAEEFSEAYGLDVIRIPPHRPSKRIDHKPEVFISQVGWKDRVSMLVSQAAAADRPVLLGTSSVEESEQVTSIVASIPFATTLTEQELLVLRRASPYLMDGLPPHLMKNPASDAQLTVEEAKVARQMVASTVSRLLGSRKLSPGMGGDVQTALFCTDYLLLPGEVNDALQRTLREILQRSALGQCRQINVLNARPERAKKEAETIAQAGLPGIITVATSMAGRGTDILLGGNPKGLATMALKKTINPLKGGFEKRREDVAELFGFPVFRAFRSLAGTEGAEGAGDSDSAHSLPPALRQTYLEVQRACAVNMTDTLRLSDEDVNRVMESVEKYRSAFLAYVRSLGDASPTLEGALEWLDNTTEKKQSTKDMMDAVLHRYALLLWLWFDGECERYAAQVRAAGGLAVVITSLQDTRRTELQLRGRAGRQGDPGETHVVASRQDPSLEVLLSLAPAQLTQLWAFVESESAPDAVLPLGTVEPLLKRLTRGTEHAGQAAREATRKFDDVVDPLRRHVYRLRRVIAGGGDAARSAIILRALESLAMGVESEPKTALLEIVQDLFNASSYSLPPQVLHSSGSIESSNPMHIVFDAFFHENNDHQHGIDFTVRARVRGLEDVSNSIRQPAGSLGGGSGAFGRHDSLVAGVGNKVLPSYGIRKRALVAPLEKNRNIFVVAYQRRRSALRQLLQSSSIGEHCNPLQAESIIRLLERDALLACLDDLWADYLQDMNTLQRAASTRAFSQFDPIDEFRLESNQAFSRLLHDFNHQAVVAIFAPIDVRAVQHYLDIVSNRDDRVQGLLQDVAWATTMAGA